MKHRDVVANFIFRWSNDEKTKQEVALFQRSTHPNVRSYQGKYAPISGSIDDDDQSPEAAAEREIHEETQLTAHKHLTLEFCGQSFSFVDEQAQRSWTVYPFGWILEADESKIEIDWEHSGWSWFDPKRILDGNMNDKCVPNIHKSLQRVYFGPQGMFRSSDWLIKRDNTAGAIFLQTISGLKTNTKDSARVLATGALKGLLQLAEYFETEPKTEQNAGEYWYALRVAAYHLIYSGRPSMNAAISAAVLDALHSISTIFSHHEFDLRTAKSTLQTSISDRASTSTKVAQAFSTFISKETDHPHSALESLPSRTSSAEQSINLLTMSMSSTILAALQHLIQDRSPHDTINLTILESRPSCEGATMAALLLTSIQDAAIKPHLNIKIAPESHAFLLVKSGSVVLLGADRITSTGHVINKTGSAQLAFIASTLAQSRPCKVIVLSEEDKIAKPDPSSLEAYTNHIHKDDHGSLSDEDRQIFEGLSQKELGHGHAEKHDVGEVYGAWTEDAQKTLLPYINDESTTRQGKVSVQVENIYFEPINSACITHYVSESGQVTRAQILRKSIARAKLERQLFGDLWG